MTGRKATAWEIASTSEQVVVLRRLLDRHPELRAEADRLVLTVLQAVERDDVAYDVSTALESVSTAVVGAHSGRQRGRGYVEASDAAWELLGAAVDPFLLRLRQLVDLGLRDAATEVGAGVILGLSQASGDDECAIYFEPDFVTEKSAEVLANMEELSLDVEGLGAID